MANQDRGQVTMRVDQTVTMTIQAKDDEGEAQAISGATYTWTTSDAGVASIAAGLDEWSKVITGEAAGTAVIFVEQPNGDTETVNVVVKVQVPGEIGLSFGTPTGP